MDKTLAPSPRSDRRGFLKSGALIAAPVAAAAIPAVALADDGERARLARLEDERELGALHRRFLRHLNGHGDCSASITAPEAIDLGQGVRAMAEDLSHEPEWILADDGLTASARCACTVEREADLGGDSTLERMARFQGHGSHRHTEHKVLTTAFAKGREGWRIVGAALG